jgi:signal transduction histidine kinase/CheY-like chemotaxis protein/CHASE3 domain sensor protein
MSSRPTASFIHRWSNLPLRAKGLVVVAIPLMALAFTFISSGVVNREQAAARVWVDHTWEVRVSIQKALGSLLEAETGARGYLLTRQEEFLEPYRAAEKSLPASVSRLHDLVRDNPPQTQRLRGVQLLANERLEQLGALAKTAERAAALLDEDQKKLLIQGREVMEKLRKELGAMNRAEQELMTERTARVRRIERWQAIANVSGVAAGALGGIIAVLLFSNGVVRRVQRLEENTGRLSREEPLLPSTLGTDEIGRLARGLEQASALLASRQEALRVDAQRLSGVVMAQQEIASGELDLKAIMQVIAAYAQQLTGAGGSAIELVEGDEMVYEAATGSAADHVGLRLKIDSCLSGLCVSMGTILNCEDSEADERVDQEACRKIGARSMLVVPFRHQQHIIGVLEALSSMPRAFGSEDIQALQLLAGLIGAAIPRKQAEEALRQAREEADRANMAKSEFLSRMSHELRTPLNAILGFSQLMEMDESLNAEHRDSVDQILKGGRHLLGLINEVLDIARIEAGRMTISSEAVPVGELLQETFTLIKPLAVELEVRLEETLSIQRERHVLADRQRLKQVLLNLVSNAIKYNRVGGKVTVSGSKVADSSDENGGGRLCISVADTGLGMSPENLARLFTPFDRLGAEQRAIEGTGLGLTLARRMVELMGGRLVVESKLGEGSTFSVELPLVESPVEEHERTAGNADSAPVAQPQDARTLLYVEDNLSNLRLIERILAHRPGIKLIPAMQGRLGFELAREHAPDLILLDLNLPDISGQEVLARLRRDEKTRSIPVVIVSADATQGQIERLLAAGAQDYLTKPLEVARFLQVLDETLKEPSPKRLPSTK